MVTMPKNTKKSIVYDQLKRSIISGEISAGTILNEAELVQSLGVGKTPIREALIMLSHEGLVDAMPRVGYVVTRLTIQDMLEIFALRILLEVDAIGMAAERITENDIHKLEDNNKREAALAKGKAGTSLKEQGYQLNREFHLIIAQATGNQRLVRLIQDLIDDLERALSFDPYIADPSQHGGIIQCLKSRDKTKAQAAMREHIEETRNRIVNRF
jgi:DNA-binding GntR family transcriptional regulator